MNTGGEAAEQIVRMSLEGFEVAAKITGAGAKNIAILLYSILKEEKKTKGKARLTSMLRSGKELKVFTVKSGDLKKFTQEAKKYGVLYCVLTDRKNKDPNAEVDVIARAEDTEHCHKLNEQLQTWLLSLIFNRLKMSWVIIYNTSKLLSGQTFCCPCFLDCLSYRCKIEVKIIVSCVHKLTTLYLQNATVIFYRNVSSYRTV